MPAPPVYLDECIDRPLADALRTRGFAVSTAHDSTTLGESDKAQLAYASQNGFVLLSYSRVDFIRLHRNHLERGTPHGGIILIPQRAPLDRRVLRAAMMLDWLSEIEFRSRLFTWGDLHVQLTRGYRPPGAYDGSDVRTALGWA